MTVQGKSCRACAVCLNAVRVKVQPVVRSYGMCLSVLAIFASLLPCDKFTYRTAGQGCWAGSPLARIGCNMEVSAAQAARKTSLIVVNELEDRAAHGGGDVAFVARS